MNLNSNTLCETKKVFARLKHLRCKLPVLNHLLLTAGPNGIELAATDLDHWLETRISDLPTNNARFLIPPAAMESACRADKGTEVTFASCGGIRSREIRLTLTSGGIRSVAVYPTIDPSEFPSRPSTIGTTTELPPTTLKRLAEIAGCASTDTSRHIHNGVLFTPNDGGRLVATDGKRLACCPAIVPLQSFVLPTAACRIISHLDFTSNVANITWVDHLDEEQRRVVIQCGRHQLVSKPLIGNYPNYQQVIPTDAEQIAVIPHDRKPGLVAWLRSLGSDRSSVSLDWQKRGHLTLIHRDANGHSATMQVPVDIHGKLPVIAFDARYLADALEIGSMLCLSDELSPGVCRHPTGRFCVIMPLRVTIPTDTTAFSTAPSPHQTQAAA